MHFMRWMLFGLLSAIFLARASAEEMPDFEVFHRFEQAHVAHLLGEQVCEYMYGDSLPNEQGRDAARKTCAAVQHPLYWLSQQQPEWWNRHKPQILKSLDAYIADNAHNSFEENHREWCKSHPQECFSVPGPMPCVAQPWLCDLNEKPLGNSLRDQMK
jgi:hypothetical protein